MDNHQGSPILLINNQKLIGIHYGASKNFEFNKGTLLLYSIIEFATIKNNLLLINKEGKIIDNNENNNYIIGEFDINEDNQDVRIINSYEQFYKENYFLKYEKEYENEKEIKDNCEIRINNEIIPFSYFHKFNKKGKYKIKYTFKNNTKNTNFMFYKCSSLKEINLSNFNTNNVTNMSRMFYECEKLTKNNIITKDKRILELFNH